MIDNTDQPKKNNNDESGIVDFGKSVLNAAVQNPLNSAVQIIDCTGLKLPEMHYFDPAEPSTGAHNFAEQAGNAVGMIVPFFIARGAVKGVTKLAGLETGTTALSAGLEQGAIGGVMGLGLTPTKAGQDPIMGRLQSALVDAGTFGVMGYSGAKLGSAFGGASSELPLSSRIVRSSLIGVGSGLPAGFTNAELTSFANGQGPASISDVAGDMAGFAALGGITGGIEGLRAKSAPEASPLSEIQQRFPQYTSDQFASGRAVVRDELSQVKGSSLEGRPQSVLDKFDQSNLSDAQKERVANSLFAIRENYTGFRADDGQMDGDQEKNWIHTQGEFGRLLDAARDAKLTPQETEDAALASMFSDSVKVKSNFMVHHLDGAKAADAFLSSTLDSDFTPERLHGIQQAIKEHQIGPPGFMAMIYSNNIRAGINLERGTEFDALEKIPAADRTGPQVSRLQDLTNSSDSFDARAREIAQLKAAGPSADQSRLEQLSARQQNGRYVTDDESNAISSLAVKIANPLNVNLTDTAFGGKAAALTDSEHQLLERTGNHQWFIPDQSTPWYKVSRALINADSIDNYATPGGLSKLVGLNGPETDIFFRDPTIDDSMAHPRKNFSQTYGIMTPEGQALADHEIANTDQAIASAKGRTETWIREQKGVTGDQPTPSVPYWNTELKYPDRGEDENDWWRINKIAPSDRTAADQKVWDDNRYTGLTAAQIDDFSFAKQIRERMVDELRREQRVNGDLPPDFQPLVARSPEKS